MFDLALFRLAMMVVAAAFLALERIAPGREMPHAPGWYGRAILINPVQVAITFATNHLWLDLLSGLFHLAKLESAVLQGIHRLVRRHIRLLLVAPHPPSARLLGCLPPGSPFSGAMTAFYKHSIEILTDSALAAVVVYPLLGSSLEGALWFNFFAAAGRCSITRTSRRHIG